MSVRHLPPCAGMNGLFKAGVCAARSGLWRRVASPRPALPVHLGRQVALFLALRCFGPVRLAATPCGGAFAATRVCRRRAAEGWTGPTGHHPQSPHERRMSRGAKLERRLQLHARVRSAESQHCARVDRTRAANVLRSQRLQREDEAWRLVHSPQRQSSDLAAAREALRVGEVQRQLEKKYRRRGHRHF